MFRTLCQLAREQPGSAAQVERGGTGCWNMAQQNLMVVGVVAPSIISKGREAVEVVANWDHIHSDNPVLWLVGCMTLYNRVWSDESTGDYAASA